MDLGHLWIVLSYMELLCMKKYNLVHCLCKRSVVFTLMCLCEQKYLFPYLIRPQKNHKNGENYALYRRLILYKRKKECLFYNFEMTKCTMHGSFPF